MNSEKRREEIIKRLDGADAPVSASKLAEELGVSRQVIVQDIALLRAGGMDISSHSRGYVLEKSDICKRIFKVHHTNEDVERELNIFVDAGGIVEDVFIFHKAYGTVRAPMGIKSRRQVKQFLNDIATGKSSLLMNATSGYHYHTITADSTETLDLIENNLRENNFLAPLQEYEPDGVN